MKARRPAVSTPRLVSVALVAVLVFGAGYYFMGQGGAGEPTSTSAAGTSLSSTGTSSTLSSETASGKVIVSFDASDVLASSDVIANYTTTVTELGSVPRTLVISAAAPAGITVALDPPQLIAGTRTGPVASIQVDPATMPGSYRVNLTATGGGETYSSVLTLQVVTFLVVTVGSLYIPQNMTVPVNSTVYWMRLNGALSQYDNGQHNVVFINGMASSPALQQYESYSYQFAEAGDYPYYCTFHPWQKGDVTVTP